jgi:hypothetical protein
VVPALKYILQESLWSVLEATGSFCRRLQNGVGAGMILTFFSMPGNLNFGTQPALARV